MKNMKSKEQLNKALKSLGKLDPRLKVAAAVVTVVLLVLETYALI